MAELALASVTKTFGEVVAVNDFSLTVHDHEFLVLLGPSGAGKTTTLRTVAGLEKPDSGKVSIDHKEVNALTPAERNVAFVFQFYALYPFMTAYDNMAFPLKANPMPKAEIDKRVRDAARILQIEHLLKRKPGQLSGGEQQRVALGRAMVRRPQAYLMDEPLTNLDAKLRTSMRAELKHLQRDLGVTTLYVTHDQIEAMTMGDRIAVLKKGRLQQIGTPREIYESPLNISVASFVGHPMMALLRCRIAGDALQIEGSNVSLSATGSLLGAVKRATKQQVVLGLRSEDVTVHVSATPDAVPAEVYAVEPLGDRCIYDLQVGGTLVRARTDPEFMLNQGDRVWISFDSERAHLFDAQTEERIA
ncbi:MAG: Sugar transporter ATP-binding protein [Chloroflexi bacterium]|jgi:multiple sugar transport system ATP-binding protein|nr:Sugar transporter ATP-binding protein [Chloroflexota bacterium]